jgi:hypothetical protein
VFASSAMHFVNPRQALLASIPSIRARMTRRVVRSTRGPTAEPFRAPLMRSPSQRPGTVRGRHVGGALGHRRHVGELALSIHPLRPRPARLARLTQRRQQYAPPGAAGPHRQAHIDGLGREVFSHVVRIRAWETSGHLFGRAAFRQMRPHLLPQPGVQKFTGSPWLTGSGGRLDRRRTGTIGAAPRGVAGPLAAHGAGGPPQHRRHCPQRMAVCQAQAHGLRHSYVYRISFAWQHRSPSGREVLHLELELKPQLVKSASSGSHRMRGEVASCSL